MPDHPTVEDRLQRIEEELHAHVEALERIGELIQQVNTAFVSGQLGVVDGDGRQLATMEPGAHGGRLVILDWHERPVAAIEATEAGGAIRAFDADGQSHSFGPGA